MTNLQTIFSYFSDPLSDTGILMILVLIDTVLAITYKMSKKASSFISSKMLSGLLRNLLLSIVPLMVTLISDLDPRTDDLYAILSFIFFIFIAWAILVSIISYTSLLGIKYPEWLLKLLTGEIESKGLKINIGSDSDGKSKSGSSSSDR